MGRHGGGSRGGGGGRSGGSRGGSRSGGRSSVRTSKQPFSGSYNRSYYDRRGRFHACYTNSRSFGKQRGWNVGVIFALLFITFHMFVMVGGTFASAIQFGSKVSGNTDRIFIDDRIDILTDAEEKQVLEVFRAVYDQSGMPITLYTDDFTWQSYYSSIEVYSEELYYALGYEEDAMVILFTQEDMDGFTDWVYDMYCGDDTIKCFSDAAFDQLLDRFHKSMASGNLAAALENAWTDVMPKLAKTTFDWSILPVFLFIVPIYGIFYFSLLSGMKKKNDAYKYFKEHPEQLSDDPVSMYGQAPFGPTATPAPAPAAVTLYGQCPSCGAPNEDGFDVCRYCGTMLKTQDGNTTYIRP